MKSIQSFMLTALMLVNIAVFAQPKTPDWVNKVDTRKFSFKQTNYLVNKYGSANDGKTLATNAIQKAIDDCAAKGEPASKGIAKIQNINVFNVTAIGAKKAINGIGFSETILKNFNLTNFKVDANVAGTIDYGENWTFEQVNITTADKSVLKISNSINVKP